MVLKLKEYEPWLRKTSTVVKINEFVKNASHFKLPSLCYLLPCKRRTSWSIKSTRKINNFFTQISTKHVIDVNKPYFKWVDRILQWFFKENVEKHLFSMIFVFSLLDIKFCSKSFRWLYEIDQFVMVSIMGILFKVEKFQINIIQLIVYFT